ncbi:MAG: response regulator [Promethearchaeota archaeon]
MRVISEQIKKTKEMGQFEEETGRKAIWRNKITESFKKWQKGEKTYNINRDRISIYVPEGIKSEWSRFAEEHNYSTLSKLIRESLKFFREYHSQIFNQKKIIDIDFISQLSHDLKDPLTSLKANLQLILEDHESPSKENVINILKSAFNQCLILENTIKEKLDSISSKKDEIKTEEKIKCDILLIEDDLELVKFLNSYFTSKGYSSIVAMNGTEGFEKLTNYQPKLVLLDIILPDINGYEIFKSIRLDESTKDLPVIFLTAIPKAEALKKVEELDVDGLISKPFDLKDLKIVYDYINE